MIANNKKIHRLLAVSVIAAVIPLGLLARSHRSGADPFTIDGFLASYTGDTLWPVMFFFLARMLFPTASGRSITLGVLSLTLTLEFGQLCQLEFLQQLRKLPLIRFALGNTFLWSDVACLSVGTAIAFLIDLSMQWAIDRRRSPSGPSVRPQKGAE